MAELRSLRERIDAVDRELLALLNRRAALALEVGEIKKREGSPVFRPEREAQVIDGLKALNTGPLRHDSVAPIWREIMSACRALEAPTRVAYLGPAGTFSEQAALGFFGCIDRRACPAPASTRCSAAPARGAADFGVVPVENSHRRRGRALARPVPAHAAVHRRRDQPVRAPQPAARATTLERHRAPCCAHPQALAQCHAWLSHAPAAGRAPAGGEQRRGRAPGGADPTLAAIASDRAASEYGLHVVAPAIQDDPHNRTRFAIVAHPQHHPAPPGHRPRLHQPRGVGGQPPGRRARHAGAAEEPRRFDDALRDRARRAPGSGSTISTSTSKATPTSRAWPRH